MTYHIRQIAQILDARFLKKSEDALIRELLLDSRRVIFPSTSLFFAIKGPRRDGHSFLAEAYSKGIRNFVISEEHALPPLAEDAVPVAGHATAELILRADDINIIVVPDVLQALQKLAGYHRHLFTLPVIGITGSNGKTIVKDWLNQLLGARYKIVRSPKSYNSQIGVPVSIWQLNKNAELGIFEAGISSPGEMEKLQAMIRPRIGVFTNIGDAHASGFSSQRQKIQEKLTLFADAEVLVYCSDYSDLHEEIVEFYRTDHAGINSNTRLFSWSRSGPAVLTVQKTEQQGNSTLIAGNYDGRSVQISIPFVDAASIENAVNCWSVLLYLGVPDQEIQTGMMALHPVAMRLEMRTGINHSTVINDSYSADLSSLRIALDFLVQQQQHNKRTVILSDFAETGRPEMELYADVGESLREHEIDRFIGIGPAIFRNQSYFERLQSAVFFPSVEDFQQQFPRIHFGNEIILIKGARAFELERVNRMLEMQTHQTVLEINLGALIHNLSRYQQLLNPGTKVMAMVKAFSYGSGSYEVASALQFNKVDYLAVAYADEGVELRKGGITLPIMVMNPDEDSFDALVNYNLEPEMYSPQLIASFGHYLSEEGLKQFPIHIELETGMHRLGFSADQVGYLLNELHGDQFKVQSVFSHLVASEDPHFDSFTMEQARLFASLSDQIARALPYPFLRHLLNTAGISRHASLQFDMVRLGIGLYGISQRTSMELQGVSVLKSAIAQIKELGAGETVSYGRTGTLLRDSRIATVRIGYADGYPRSLGNGRGKMLIQGQQVPTIGSVCMDMTMIDITGLKGVVEGDEVVVFGKGLPVEQVAEWAGTIPYEILTGVSQRVKRVYFQE